MNKNRKRHIPNILTVLNMFLGFSAIGMLINGDPNPVRKRLVDVSWTKRDLPEFIDNETLDMIFTYHAKKEMRI